MTARERWTAFNRTALRYRIEKWFWLAMVVPTVLWFSQSVLWVGLMSAYALTLTAGGAERAAEAAAEVTKDEPS